MDSSSRNERSKPVEWYSVREAAKYLGVSEPTIFRWMKESVLSFYKVGGSTRFTRDGLNAVIEKTTGAAEAEAVKGRCAACGHSVLIDGKVQGAGRLYFTPAKS
jgi:excisionase family DNA binding protein